MDTPNIIKHLLYMSISRCHHHLPHLHQRRVGRGRGRGVTSHSSKLTGSECGCCVGSACNRLQFQTFLLKTFIFPQVKSSLQRSEQNLLTSAWKKYFVHSGIEHFNERQHFLYTLASERQIV